MNTIRHSGLAKVRATVAAVVGAGCLLAVSANDARAWEINFEGLADGVTVANQYGTVGAISGAVFGTTAQFSGFDAAGTASSVQTLDTANQPNKSDFRAPFSKFNDSTNQLSPGNILVLAGQGAGSIVIDFSRPTFIEGANFFDIDHKEVQTLNESNEIQFFDVKGNQILDNAFYTPETGNKQWNSFFAGIYNVKRMVVNLAGSGAIDRIRGQEIPEPGHSGIMVFGIAALAWMYRRRRAAHTA